MNVLGNEQRVEISKNAFHSFSGRTGKKELEEQGILGVHMLKCLLWLEQTFLSRLPVKETFFDHPKETSPI